nr:hypothetical protein Iba_scaffold15549CG0010 [Ipomoea batatas]
MIKRLISGHSDAYWQNFVLATSFSRMILPQHYLLEWLVLYLQLTKRCWPKEKIHTNISPKITCFMNGIRNPTDWNT